MGNSAIVKREDGTRFCLLVILALFFLSACAAKHEEIASSQANKKDPGPYEAAAVTYEWFDGERDREVPTKIYYPKTGDGPFPVIIFSHGHGGSRTMYGYLGRHWASHGYVSVHVQHRGSDTKIWQQKSLRPVKAKRRALFDPKNKVNRPLDIRFAIDRMEKMNGGETPLKERLDLAHIGVAGHSYGAFTTLAAIGMVFAGEGDRETVLPDPRIKAAIPMSTPMLIKRDTLSRAFTQIGVPCLHMTGTKDQSPLGITLVEERRVPFDRIGGGDQYLVNFKDGDHMVFAIPKRVPGKGKTYALIHDLTRMVTTVFWDAYLKGDARARAWLAGGGFEASLGEDGTFEKKLERSF